MQKIPPMRVRLLGACVAEIDGRRIEWLRRRDRQVFKYLALSPSGSASRAELKRLFWPHCEQRQLAQRLQIVCSNIRKAIGNAVGDEHVENYFHCGEYLAIDFQNVIVDADTFMLQADAADAVYARGRLRSAYAMYCRADRLYQGDLLVCYGEEQWVEQRACALEARYAIVLERIAEIDAAFGEQARTSVRLLNTAEELTLVLDMYLTAGIELPNSANLQSIAADLIIDDPEEPR